VSTSTLILIVVILVILAIAAAVVSMRVRRRSAERELFGPEYDRLADEVGPRKANAEFEKRRQRVDGLGLKSLSAERRTAYTSQWEAAQEQFIDNPALAVSAAGDLVTVVAAGLGYEVTDHDQLLTDLSVYHGRHLDGYRHSRQVTELAGQATTEDLRQALLDYRGLFFGLLEHDPLESSDDARPGSGQVAAEVPAQRPWKQVTQGLHWKTRQQEDSGVPASRP
jgi:flagellar basal body-associated protein FliL